METTVTDTSVLTNLLMKLDMYSLLKIALVAIVGLIAIKYAIKLLRRFLRKTELGDNINNAIIGIVRFGLYLVLFTAVADMIGLPPSSLVTIVATFGLAFSLAMQDILANIAGGILLLYTRPFGVGDYIESCSVEGTVDKIGLIHTSLTTIDNKRIFLPNGTLSKDTIVNYSSEKQRRLELHFNIDFDCDTEKAKLIIEEMVNKSPFVDKDMPILVRVWAINENAVDIIARCWADKDDFLEAKCSLLEDVKFAFDKRGIKIPRRQVEIVSK